MVNSVRLRASRHLEQRASCRRLLAAQLLSRGDLVDRDAPSADCQNAIKQPQRPARSRPRVGSVSVSTTLGHEPCRANAIGSPGRTSAFAD
jgi:hypothetical protein